jgi:ABC-type xylose transport system permease subunit
MKIQKIIGEKGEMPQLCRGGSCPAAILTEGGDLFIQGYVPSITEGSQLSGPTGESFVKMPRAVFEKIARQVLNA